MPELCHRQIIRQQQIMKKSALTVLIALLPLAATAQTPSINGNGKKIEKEKMESKDYLPKIHGTIRAKYEFKIIITLIFISHRNHQSGSLYHIQIGRAHV